MKPFRFHASLAALLLVMSSVANAAPVSYNIVFGPGKSSTPSASFVYDASLAVNQQFLSFTVTELAYVFDFRATANNFVFRTAGSFSTACNTPTVNDAFELLTNAACVAGAPNLGGRFWEFTLGFGQSDFAFKANSGSPLATDSLEVAVLNGTVSPSGDSGMSFIAAPVAVGVPEPASIALLGIGLVAAAGAARRRVRRAI